MNEDDPHLEFLSLEEARSPSKDAFYHLMLNRWWMAHPEKGLVLYRANKKSRSASPQCNSNKEIVEKFSETMYPWAKAVFVEKAFVQIDVRDYYP